MAGHVSEELDSIGRERNPKYRTTDFMKIIENEELDGIAIASSFQQHWFEQYREFFAPEIINWNYTILRVLD